MFGWYYPELICLLAEALCFLDHCSFSMGLKTPLGAVARVHSLILSVKFYWSLCCSWDCNCSAEMGFISPTCAENGTETLSCSPRALLAAGGQKLSPLDGFA